MLAIFQVDAASIEMVERMLAEGRMPVLAELRKRGRWERLGSPTDLFETAAYPTLYSGIDVADHGLYYPLAWSPRDQRVRYMEAFQTPELTWERLSRAGARSLVIDPYQAWETSPVDGVCISGWQYRHRIIPRWSQPASVYRRAVRRHGRPPLLADVAGTRSAPELLGMLRALAASPKRGADLACDLLGEERFDLAWVSLIGVHQAGHHLWDLSQIQGAMDEGDRARLESGLADVYTAADTALGRMVDALPAGADVVVLSPLGMGPNTTRSDLLPGMLERILSGGSASEDGGGSGQGVWRTRARFPPALRRAVSRALPGSAVRALLTGLYTRGIDWSSTRAFALPGDHFGYLRLNLRGREREGIVAPEDEESLLDQIASGLKTFRDEAGTPSIAQVHRPARELKGDGLEMLPDLVVRWSDHPATRLEAVVSPEFGRVPRLGGGIGRSGNHWPGAWVLRVPGRSAPRELGRAPELIDLAATACSVAGHGELPGQPLFH